MTSSINTDVIIIGAGPTGLALACQFVRYGIDFVIIDKKEKLTPYSKAIGVHARTLEIYQQMGLAQKAIERGTIVETVRMLTDGQVRGEMNLANIGEDLSPYPFVLMLEQSKNEQLLYQYLQDHGKEVRWQRELDSFTQTDTGVTAQVTTPDGERQVVEARYLVGCDGADSFVRHTLDLGFEGSTFERVFYVADALIDWHLPHDALHVCLAKESFVVFFALKGEKRYRIVGAFPEGYAKDDSDVLYEEIERRINDKSKVDLDIHDVEWFSTYKVHTRHVNRFFEGRCFLAGDSAHIHSPAGAQGMNTGIQDAYNLAWKMALVLKNNADTNILGTYNHERLANAKHLLRTTDRMFQLAAGSGWLIAFIRTRVVPYVAKYILSLDVVKNALFPLVSQIGISYPESALSRHAGDETFKFTAGDRMPWFLVDGESIYNKLTQPKFHWLIFSDAQDDVETLTGELENKYTAMLDCHSIPLDPQIAAIFGTEKSFSVLLRPDNHIGFISADAAVNELRDYLDTLF